MANGFKNAINTLKTAIGDLSSLEVQTISGTLNTTVTPDDGTAPASGGSVINWTEAIKDAKKTDGEVKLMLATKINFDGDATLFLREGEIPQHILDAHNKAVTAGIETRHAIMSLVKSTIVNVAS